jgi:hypothetical protein
MEVDYQRALELALPKYGLRFQREVEIPMFALPASGRLSNLLAGQFWRETFGRKTTGSYAARQTADRVSVAFSCCS